MQAAGAVEPPGAGLSEGALSDAAMQAPPENFQ